MATTDQLRKAERRGLGPVPPLNSYTRDGWCGLVHAMDMARFGEPRTLVNWRWTKAYLRAHVAKRVADGEAVPLPRWHNHNRQQPSKHPK